MELPANSYVRTYRARIFGRFNLNHVLKSVENGIEIDGVFYQKPEITLESSTDSNAWISIKLKEGKNREIRKILAHFGLVVSRLIRVGYGPFELGALKPGEIKEVRDNLIPKI